MAEQRLSELDPIFSIDSYDDAVDPASGMLWPAFGSYPAEPHWINTFHSIARGLGVVAGARIYHDSTDEDNEFSITAASYLYKGEVVTMAASTNNVLGGGDVAHYVYIDAATGVITVATAGWPTTPHVRVAVITLATGAWSWVNVVDHRSTGVLNVAAEPMGKARDVVAKTADYPVVAADCGKQFTNTGATALVTLTLPAAAVGLWYDFVVTDADGIKVLAVGSDTIRNGANVSAAAGYIQGTTIGGCLRLECVAAGQWFCTSVNGTWGTPT